MMPEIGKLYFNKEFYLIIYPHPINSTKITLPSRVIALDSAAKRADKFLSAELNCQVRHSKLSDIFLILGTETIDNKIFIKCLFPEFVGWILWDYWIEDNVKRLEA